MRGITVMAETRVTLPVEGMTCGACALTVQKQLAATPGVADAAVNYATGKATVSIDESRVRVSDLVNAVREAGYDTGKSSVSFPVEDLHYATGVSHLEDEIRKLPGVLSVTANQATEHVAVEYVPGVIGTREVQAAIEQAGFHVAELIAEPDPVERERIQREREVRSLRMKFIVAAAVAVVTMILSMPLMAHGAESHDLVVK